MSRPLSGASILLSSTRSRPLPSSPRLLSRRTLYGYTQAKALIYSQHGEPKDVLQLHTPSPPPPHSTLLTLATLASPLNPADINQIQGTYASLPPLLPVLSSPNPIAVPGNEAVFQVLATGSSTTTVKKGDWVIPASTGLGTWRSHLQVPESEVVRVEKEGLKPTDVATVSVNPVTAWRMLVDFVALEEGAWFIQNGSNSGVGRAALQLGRKWGYKSIAVVRDRPGEEGEKLRREMEALGATVVVSEDEAQARDFPARVKELTGGTGPRLALNCVGGRSALSLAKVLVPGGTLVTYGAMARQPLNIPAGMLIFKDLRFEGFWVSKWADGHPAEKKRVVEEVLDMVRRREFKMGPVVEVSWGGRTGREELVEAVQGTLEGFRGGKGVFVFEGE
ncbi:mitochondrial 2-enoyl thioester reductase [Thelotrema lepadinum]|nr:mitochondrial 2-enoyl thioester reductase [Thelotrema lepadinum]